MTSKAPEDGLAPPQQTPDHLFSPLLNPYRLFPRPVVLPPSPIFHLLSSEGHHRPRSPGHVHCLAWASTTPQANGTHSFPAAQHGHSQQWGPNHGPTSRPSGHQSPCWGLSSSIWANCSSPGSRSLIPPRAVPAFLRVDTVSASLCHPYLCPFGKLTPVQLVASVLLELLN